MLPLLLVAVTASAAAATTPTRPTVVPARATAAVRIDGKLDDPAWSAATPFTGFVQKYPREGRTPSEPTSVRVLYDDRTLYVAIDCVQRRAPIVARLTRRDRVVEADRVAVYLDSMLDRKTAVQLEVNAAGVQADALHFDDTNSTFDWDEVWRSAVARRAGGWSVELAIPLRLLRLRPRDRQTWGFQVRRYVVATQEQDELAFIPRDGGGEVSRYGQLGPFDHLQRPLGVELRPFATSQLSHQPRASSVEPGFSAGLDGRWRLARTAALDFTVNPDFGQVEADQVVLNLTNFETFFPEKRPFFLHGLDLFATPINVLYTRRIGQVPAAPALAAGQSLAEPLGPARIDTAAKLTGRHGALSYATLAALTHETAVDVRNPDNTTQSVRVAPFTLYEALRLKLDVSSHASLGAIATGTNRFAGQRDSWIGGVDGAWRSVGGAWAVGGQAVLSKVLGGEARQLADGTVIASGDTSGAAVLSIQKQGGNAVGELVCDGRGRRFDPNDLGFLERQNQLHCFGSVGWHDTSAGRWLDETRHNLEVYYRANLDGLALGSGYQINTSGHLRSTWSYFTELHLRPAHFDDREVGDGTAIERSGLLGWELGLSSDPRRRVAVNLEGTAQWLGNGVNLEAGSTWTFHVHPQLDLQLLQTAQFTAGEPRYVGDDAGDRLFAREKALALGLTVKSTYTFTTSFSVQASAQLFVDRLAFTEFSSAPASQRVAHLADLVPHAPPVESVDGDYGAVNGSLVTRWEFRPGSTLYVVFSHAQQRSDAAMSPGIVPPLAVLRAPAADAVLLKLSWLLI